MEVNENTVRNVSQILTNSLSVDNNIRKEGMTNVITNNLNLF